jgi:prefoldin subunit 5
VRGTAEVDAAMDPIHTARELATHANDIKHLQDDMDRLVSDMEEIKRAIQGIEKSLSEAKGGRKVLFAAMSAASLFGGIATWVLDKWILK